MREIKFRAWAEGPKKMFSWEQMLELQNKFYTWFKWTDMYRLLQFTGLYDESGREIYEGDILAHIDAYDSLFGKVVWDDKAACWAFAILMEDGSFDLDRLDDHAAYAEVIGNIYDNPELLK